MEHGGREPAAVFLFRSDVAAPGRAPPVGGEARPVPGWGDGPREGAWIVADYLDVVLHVFTPDAREYYRLEELWSDVLAVDVDAAAV